MEVLNQTKNIIFGISSEYSKVVEQTHKILAKLTTIPNPVLDKIIERGEAHLLNEKHFKTMLSRVRNSQSLKQVYNSFKLNEQFESIVKLIRYYFGIPPSIILDSIIIQNLLDQIDQQQ